LRHEPWVSCLGVGFRPIGGRRSLLAASCPGTTLRTAGDAPTQLRSLERGGRLCFTSSACAAVSSVTGATEQGERPPARPCSMRAGDTQGMQYSLRVPPHWCREDSQGRCNLLRCTTLLGALSHANMGHAPTCACVSMRALRVTLIWVPCSRELVAASSLPCANFVHHRGGSTAQAR
jgi:hypothetical protein